MSEQYVYGTIDPIGGTIIISHPFTVALAVNGSFVIVQYS